MAQSDKNMRSIPDDNELHSLWAAAYETNNYRDTSLSSKVLLRTHALIEKDFSNEEHFENVLEVGTGSGVHLGFVRHSFTKYVMTDASRGILDTIQVPKGLAERVTLKQADATSLPFKDNAFERVIATHVLEHIPGPQLVLQEWARVLKPGGVLSLILPCDPGIPWRLGRNLGPRRSAEKSGLPYDYFMAVEHINPIQNLVTIIDFLFPDKKARWWPLPFVPSPNFNLIYSVNIFI